LYYSNHLYHDVPTTSTQHQSYENVPSNPEVTYENSPTSAGGLYENIDQPPDCYENVPLPREQHYENIEDNVYENYDFSENRIFQEVAFKNRVQRAERAAEAGIQQFIRSIEEVHTTFMSLILAVDFNVFSPVFHRNLKIYIFFMGPI
jgi:hypothetical protein